MPQRRADSPACGSGGKNRTDYGFRQDLSWRRAHSFAVVGSHAAMLHRCTGTPTPRCSPHGCHPMPARRRKAPDRGAELDRGEYATARIPFQSLCDGLEMEAAPLRRAPVAASDSRPQSQRRVRVQARSGRMRIVEHTSRDQPLLPAMPIDPVSTAIVSSWPRSHERRRWHSRGPTPHPARRDRRSSVRKSRIKRYAAGSDTRGRARQFRRDADGSRGGCGARDEP